MGQKLVGQTINSHKSFTVLMPVQEETEESTGRKTNLKTEKNHNSQWVFTGKQ